MKKYLLDTQYIIWLLFDTSQIEKHIFKIIENFENQIFYSDISLWEIAIKTKLKKLSLNKEISEIPKAMAFQNIDNLKLNQKHIFETINIELHQQHRDPFDRLLIAQAITENLIIISTDTKFDLYHQIKRI